MGQVGLRLRSSDGRFDKRPTGTVVDRFMRNVSPEPISGCWLWVGADHGTFGYGAFKWGGRGTRTETAHRVSHKLFNGPVEKGLCVLHSCDNPACVNPAHLRVGTYRDNSRDAVTRDRHTRGERHPAAILTDEKARLAKQTSIPSAVLAAEFGCSPLTVRDARRGITWKHVNTGSKL